MIKLLKRGTYALTETKRQTKVLTLDKKQTFAWINAKGIGEILVRSRKKHTPDNILAIGRYRICDVEDEPNLTDTQHLELSVGNGVWQGYLLPTGLPKYVDKRNRVVPTDEIITKPTVNHPAN